MGTKQVTLSIVEFCLIALALTATAGGGSEEAASASWPKIFGPTEDGVCSEPGIATEWPEEGPPVLWRYPLGSSYSAPSINAGKLIAFHRVGDEEVVDALDPGTGKRLWRFGYPTQYVDRYGYNNGPRATPIIAEGRIYTFGAEGKLHCIELETGKMVWGRDLNGEYGVEQGFFGAGASPVLDGARLILNLGGKERNAGIVAIAKEDGKTLWTATDQGASYATPRVATIHGKRHAIVFTEAGLVSVDPDSGAVRFSIPFRSRLYESVNATSPVIVGDIVFASATYGTGALCIRLEAEGGYKELWRNKTSLDSHFSNMIAVGGYVYGFSGRHEGESDLRCVALETGEVKWKWDTPLGRGSMVRVGDRLILWGERGHLVSLDIRPDKPVPVSFTRDGLLRPPCWTPPAIAGGRLFLRDERTLVAYDLTAAKSP